MAIPAQPPELTTTDLAARIAALESDVSYLKDRLELVQSRAAVKRSLEHIARGETRPGEVLEELRKKYNIPSQ